MAISAMIWFFCVFHIRKHTDFVAALLLLWLQIQYSGNGASLPSFPDPNLLSQQGFCNFF